MELMLPTVITAKNAQSVTIAILIMDLDFKNHFVMVFMIS